MITHSDPAFETVLLRDLDISYPSGLKSITLEPEDIFVIDPTSHDIRVVIAKDGHEQVYWGTHMECYSVQVRPFRRKKLESRGVDLGAVEGLVS